MSELLSLMIGKVYFLYLICCAMKMVKVKFHFILDCML